MGKAEDPDNARDYLVLVLAAALDLIAAHDHSSTDGWNAVKRIASGTTDARPAPASAGDVYVGTNPINDPNGVLSYDIGGTWIDVAPRLRPTFITANFDLGGAAFGTDCWVLVKNTDSVAHNITTVSFVQMVAPGQVTPTSSYTTPSGESTWWYSDGSFWWCVAKG